MSLDHKQVGMLVVGLRAVFSQYAALRRFVRDACGIDLNNHVDAGAGMDAARDVAIEAVSEQGHLDAFLTACAAHTNPKLHDVAARIQEQLRRSRPLFYDDLRQAPFDALFLGQEKCFIGRQQLRSALKDMLRHQDERRVLVVNAARQPDSCGKTYTYDLLKLLDQLDPTHIVVLIDFSHFREGDLGSRYADIIAKINARMAVPAHEIPPPNESQTRWFQNAIGKFDAVARLRGQKLWLVFDNVFTGEIEDKIADALAKTAIFTVSEAAALHVVLIGVDPAALKLEPQVQRKLRRDLAALPEQAELQAFLLAARALSDPPSPVTDIDIDNAVTDILSRLAAYPPTERAYEYSQLTWKEAVRLRFIP